MSLLKWAKAMLVLVVLGCAFTWMACSDPPPVASHPAGKATDDDCELCDLLDAFGEYNDAKTDSTADDETDSTADDETDSTADAKTDSTADDETDSTADDETDSTAPEVVSFADANLERAVRQALKKPQGPLTTDDLASLTRLDVEEQNIKSLDGLEHATALDTLNLWGNEIEDVSPLSGLTNLQKLNLGNNQVADVRPLDTLTNLIQLSLWGNEVEDVSALSDLKNLEKLDLWGNEIEDVSALSDLTELTQLQLGDNEVEDVSSLDGLTNLDWMGLVDNPISQREVNEQVPTLIEKDVAVSAVVQPEPETCVYPEGALVLTVGIPFSRVMPEVRGGTPPFTYSVSGLPSGLSFDPNTRTISGTPEVAIEEACGTTYTITYTVTDAGSASVSLPYIMVIRR